MTDNTEGRFATKLNFFILNRQEVVNMNKTKDKGNFSQKMLENAPDYIKRKNFRRNLPIVVMEGDNLYLLDKNNNMKEIKSGKIKKNK